MNLQGLTCIGKFNGVDVFWSSNSDSSYHDLVSKVKNGDIDFSTLTISEIESRNKFLEKQKSPYRFWKETTGLQNVVLYNSDLFSVNSGILHSYNVSHTELPINCSSCNFMYSNMSIDNSEVFCSRFDTSSVVSTLGMFTGSVLPTGLSFGNTFDTRSVVDARFMFGRTWFGAGIEPGELFTLENAENASYLFAYSVFEHGFQLPVSFRLHGKCSNVFKCCSFPDGVNTNCSDESIIHQLQVRGT